MTSEACDAIRITVPFRVGNKLTRTFLTGQMDTRPTTILSTSSLLDNCNEVNLGVMTIQTNLVYIIIHKPRAYTILIVGPKMSVSQPFSRTLIRFWQRSLSSDDLKQNSSAVMETICNFIV